MLIRNYDLNDLGDNSIARVSTLRAQIQSSETSLSVHWLYGTRCFHHIRPGGLCYSVDNLAQQVIKEIDLIKKNAAPLSDRDIIDLVHTTKELIALYEKFEKTSSLASHLFKRLWEWLGFQPTEQEQIMALEDCVLMITALPYETYKNRYNDPSEANLTEKGTQYWTHPDLQGSYMEECPDEVYMKVEAFERQLNEQQKLLEAQ